MKTEVRRRQARRLHSDLKNMEPTLHILRSRSQDGVRLEFDFDIDNDDDERKEDDDIVLFEGPLTTSIFLKSLKFFLLKTQECLQLCDVLKCMKHTG